MTDPFDALYEPIVPIDPDPDFAAALRARIGRAQTRGEPVLIPYLAVPDGTGRRAIDWYVDILAGRPVGEPYLMPDGRVGHAEVEIAGAHIYLAEEFPEIGVIAPGPTGTPVSLSLAVPDVAETLRRAVDAGARMPRPMYDDHGSRNATMVDPFGHRWLLRTPLDQLPETDQPGDASYAWLTVPDPDRAAAFYATVLGWEYAPGHAAGGRQVVGQSMPLGIGAGEPGWHLSYGVADVAAAVARVRAAGGTAGDPEERAYGEAADGIDDQGVVFALHRAGAGPRPPANGARPGDLSYLTIEVADSARTRAFYGAVLGWEYDRGRIADGWAVREIAPMTGLSGGHEHPTAVPMWKVADVAAAVDRVRAAGGTATDPEPQPYGTTAECADDQGVRFYLGDA